MNSEFFRSLANRIESISEEAEPNEPDVIQINVPAFLRIIELVREEIKDDVPLHYLTEILVQLSSQGVVDMQHYDEIYAYTMQDADSESDSDSYAEASELSEKYRPGVTVLTRTITLEPEEINAIKRDIARAGIEMRVQGDQVTFRTAKIKTLAKILNKHIDFGATDVGSVIDIPAEIGPINL